MDSDIPLDAPRPRLCHLRKIPDFAGYGFNLHAEKGKSGQFIGKVDAGSPAVLAGLREGDRIVEVNGVNVGNENHHQVVQRIKAVTDETKFLVVDSVTDDYYREKKIVIRGDMSNVHLLETPHPHGGSHGSNGTDSKHKPRLCVLKIWPDFAGYGFNLHAEKGKAVQYIGKVDPISPAEAAGLKEHDRIVEVNGFNVSAEPHQDVVKRIKSDPKQVTMLVVDQEADAYFQREGITPSSNLPSVVRIECPDSKSIYNLDKKEVLYRPRLCHVKARSDGKGFGFNMQAEKGKPGQYIGKVDPDSPAEEAGLRDGDRLVEVNGTNVEKENHKDVVTRIKSKPDETTLLVIEKAGYEYYSAKGIVVTRTLLTGNGSDHEHKATANGQSDHHDDDDKNHHPLAAAAVISASVQEENGDGHVRIEAVQVTEDGQRTVELDKKVAVVAVSEENGTVVAKAVIVEASVELVDKKLEEHKEDTREFDDIADEITNIADNADKEDFFGKTEEKKPDKKALSLNVTSTASVSVSSTSSTSSPTPLESPKTPVVIDGIEFAGTAEEARRKMSKKRNVKDTNMSVKAKFDLFQKL